MDKPDDPVNFGKCCLSCSCLSSQGSILSLESRDVYTGFLQHLCLQTRSLVLAPDALLPALTKLMSLNFDNGHGGQCTVKTQVTHSMMGWLIPVPERLGLTSNAAPETSSYDMMLVGAHEERQARQPLPLCLRAACLVSNRGRTLLRLGTRRTLCGLKHCLARPGILQILRCWDLDDTAMSLRWSQCRHLQLGQNLPETCILAQRL